MLYHVDVDHICKRKKQAKNFTREPQDQGTISKAKAGRSLFSSSSPLEIPVRPKVLGLFPLATTKDSGGFKFSLKRCATLRPLEVGSQHFRTPTLSPKFRHRLRAFSSSTGGKR